MIQGELQLVSEVGRGSMFSVIVPVELDPMKAASSLEGMRAGAEGVVTRDR
jgi:hypothetical protein